MLLSYAQGLDGDTAPSNRGYFNASLPSLAIIPTSLSLRNQIAFSFRTCSHGNLLQETGDNGDSFSITLTPEGALEISWHSSAEDASNSTSIANGDFQNNQWYTIDSKFINGEIYVSIELGSQTKFRVLLSNSTYQRYLWDLDLSGGGGLRMGEGFTGCIQEGPGVQLSNAQTQGQNVAWDQCPLESQIRPGCGK